MELEEKLKTMDREISVNPQYVQKVSKFCHMWVLHETVNIII